MVASPVVKSATDEQSISTLGDNFPNAVHSPSKSLKKSPKTNSNMTSPKESSSNFITHNHISSSNLTKKNAKTTNPTTQTDDNEEELGETMPNPCPGTAAPEHERLANPCPPATMSGVQKTLSKESLADRWDAWLISSVFVAMMYYLVASSEEVAKWHHLKPTILNKYKWMLPIVSLTFYLIMVHIIAPMLKKDKNQTGPAFGISEKSVKTALKYWNLFLWLLSYCMLVGLGVPLAQVFWRDGFIKAMCDPNNERWGGAGMFWMYIFAYSKYFELIDTAFLIIRRKDVSFLHWYHHLTVLAYTWFAVVVGFCPGWYFATVNSAVHTIMYFYYYRSACGVRLTYDKLITTMQLTQMVIGVVITSTWSVMHFMMPKKCHCIAANWVMLAALAIYGSYFALFLSFYIKRYRKNAKTADKKTRYQVKSPISKKVA